MLEVQSCDFGLELLEANAKLNLSLVYTRENPEGLFEVNSVMAFCRLANEIEVAPYGSLRVAFTGDLADSAEIDPLDNTVTRAVELLEQEFDLNLPLNVKVQKNIPVGAGLGGGSADAAAVVRWACRKFGLDVDAVLPVVRKVGADLPPCVINSLCFVSGTGEKVEPLEVEIPPQVRVLLANPLKSLLTKDVYQRYREIGPSFADPTCSEELNQLDFWGVLKRADNHLLPPATSLMPQVADLIEALKQQEGAAFTSMSGSGATCFSIFSSDAAAQSAATQMAGRFPDYWFAVTSLI